MKPPRNEADAARSKEPPRVLVVDDDADILKMVGRYLGAQGFNVTTTTSPFGVLELLREHTPDVVVLDLMIPALDGSALSGFVRLHSKAAIVFFTASSSDRLDALRKDQPDAIIVPKGGPLTKLEAAIRSALA